MIQVASLIRRYLALLKGGHTLRRSVCAAVAIQARCVLRVERMVLRSARALQRSAGWGIPLAQVPNIGGRALADTSNAVEIRASDRSAGIAESDGDVPLCTFSYSDSPISKGYEFNTAVAPVASGEHGTEGGGRDSRGPITTCAGDARSPRSAEFSSS